MLGIFTISLMCVTNNFAYSVSVIVSKQQQSDSIEGYWYRDTKRQTRNDFLSEKFLSTAPFASILASSFTYISRVLRAILSLDLKLHDVIRTDLGSTVSPSDRLGRSISGNSGLQPRTRLFARGGGRDAIFRWISRLVILPRLWKRARPSDPNRITPRGWCMIVPTKKLNVHLINRVGSSDCAHGGARGRKWKGRLDRATTVHIPTIALTRPTAPFGFPPKFSVPRDSPRARWFRAGDRVRSITLSVNH